jgi:MoaA/NifB/PqqE/SkfB family radical SAM enzyme
MINLNPLNNLRNEIKESNTFCFYPFLELSTNTSGHIKPCCNYVGTIKKPNGDYISILKDDTFDTAWNSTAMVDLRRQLHQGDIPVQCKRCIRDGDASMRQRSINEYKNDIDILDIVRETIENNYESKHPPIIIELKPSNLCNLKCVMCNSYDSSQIAKELKEISNKHGGIIVKDGRFLSISDQPGIWESKEVFKNIDQSNWEDNEDIWENFKRIVPYLQVLSFAGGEPTIMPSVLKALTYCVENGYSKNITVFVSSNFTNLNKNFFELMIKFKKFELIASIDGYDKVNDYARYPSKWSQVSKNYILAKEYMRYPNIKILNNITVSLLNILNLTDLLYWLEDRANELPCFTEWPYHINLILHPEEQQIRLLPDHLKELATNRLNDYLEKSKVLKEFPGLDSKIHLLIRELKQPCDDNLLKVFKSRIAALDKHRNIDIGDYIPELVEIFDKK